MINELFPFLFFFDIVNGMKCAVMNPALQVIAAVGFNRKRLDIPSDLNPQVATVIEACWAKCVSFTCLQVYAI